MTKIRIIQIRSRLKSSMRQKNTLTALGLRKISDSTEVEATPQIMGMINKVSHLVKVEEL